jgi:hypothetical protein
MQAQTSGGLKALILLAMLALAWPLDVRADMLWNWPYLNPDAKITAAGTLTTKDRAADSYLIMAVTGLWNGAAITVLEAPHSCCSPPEWNNNLLVDGSPKLDKGGFAFRVSGGLKINLFYKEGRYALAQKCSAAFSTRRRAALNDLSPSSSPLRRANSWEWSCSVAQMRGRTIHRKALEKRI